MHSTRLRVDRHRTKHKSPLGVCKWTQTKTPCRTISADETARWTQDLDRVPSVRGQGTHHECGQVLYIKRNDRCATFTTRGARWSWKCGSGQISKPLRTESWIKTRVVFTPVSVVGSSGSASDPVRHLAATPQRSDTHQELTKNTMNPKSFW